MTTPPPVLVPQDFPALYQSAGRQSQSAQKSFLFWFKVRLAGIVGAAIGGAIAWTTHNIHIGGVIAALAFAAALAAELILAVQRPERVWYEGRAAAESAKTLSWRYMVCGEPFEADLDGKTADARFIAEVTDLLHDLRALHVHVPSGHPAQISAKMREIRAMPFEARRTIYLSERIHDQEDWYSRKAKWNADRAARWVIASIALEFCGLIGGAAKAFGETVKVFGWIDVDLLGVFAAAAAAATAWLQAKQHENLATSYGVASQELAAITNQLETQTDEIAWPRFVASAEEAVSREHTLWRASRAVTSKPRS